MASRKAEKAQRKAERLAREQRAREEATRKRRLLIFGIAAAAIVACAVAIVLITSSGGSGGPGSGVKGASQVNASLEGVPQKDNVIGDPKAPVTVVEFADLQCPFCRDFSNEILPKIIENYVKPGKVRMELDLLSFLGTDSETASRWALYAGKQGKMYNFAEIFYKNQGAEGTGYVTEEFLKSVAFGAGVSPLPSKQDLNDPSITKALQRSTARGQKNKIDATPSFLIGESGGRLQRLDDPNYSYEGFAAALDSLIKSP